MEYNNVWAVYFSATGTTRKVVGNIAQRMSSVMDLKYEEFDFTLPDARESALSFCASDIVVFGMPVIAGRISNILLDYLDSMKGNDALAVPIVLYGNRDFDDALIELRDILEKKGFHTVAAGAFVGEHAFSHTLAKGRPDSDDMKEAADFATVVAGKIKRGVDLQSVSVKVDGTPYPYRWYYQPKDRHGNPIDIRKVTPVTDNNCIDCKLCVSLCPLGSIDFNDVRVLNGICMKCCACIKNCPAGAKHFEDRGFIYHKEELEEIYKRRGQNRTFIISDQEF